MAGRSGKTAEQLFFTLEKGISSYMVKPLLPSSSKAVILAYHNIPQNAKEAALLPDSVPAEKFEQQMRFLREHNFNIISLGDLAGLLREKKEIRKKTIVLTFDDGYKTFLLQALPVLHKYDLPATVLIAVDFIGTQRPFAWLVASAQNSENVLPMDWQDILELRDNGFEIGSHTCSHQFLPAMRRQQIEKEVIYSGDLIEAKIGARPRSFAVPFSFPLHQKAWPHFQTTFFELLERGGYAACCTSTRGTIDIRSHPFYLQRFFITTYDDLASFHAKALGAYSWTRFPQFVYQRYLKNYDNLINALNG